MSIPQTPSPLSNILAAKTYNAAWFSGSTKELQITAAIAAAVLDGALYVYIPSNMLPYNSGAVTFNSTVQLIREGGPSQGSNTLDAGAYGGVNNEATITVAIAQAVASGKRFVFVSQAMLPYTASLVTFNNAVRMVREGGHSVWYDLRAYGAAGDNATVDTVAIQACLSAARAGFNNNAIRNVIYGPAGTYLVDAQLNFSDLSFYGDGMIATSLRLKNGSGAIQSIMLMDGGGQALYQNFNVDGNKANNGSQLVTGIRISGAALWSQWNSIYVHDMDGNGMHWVTNGGLRPLQHNYSNITIRNCNRIGARLDAGRNLSFYNLDVETCGLISSGLALVALTGTNEACQRILFDNLWCEKVGVDGASADAVEIDAGDKITFRKCNVVDYGNNAGGGGNGFNLIGGSNIEIDGCDISGRGPSAAGGRKIKIAAGITGTVLRNMSGLSSTGAAMDVEDLSTVGAAWVGLRNSSSTIRPSEAVLVSGVDVSAGDNIIPVALTAARLVGAPLNPVQGQLITFTIIQGGAGGFAVTWNAIFKKTWSDAGNAAGTRSSIMFVYDGTNWNQVSAQSPYV